LPTCFAFTVLPRTRPFTDVIFFPAISFVVTINIIDASIYYEFTYKYSITKVRYSTVPDVDLDNGLIKEYCAHRTANTTTTEPTLATVVVEPVCPLTTPQIQAQ